MTQQEMIEQNVRLALGDLTLQLIVLKARIAELEQQPPEPTEAKPNGKGKGKEPDHGEGDHLS
jgi:hypothetical protein